MQEALTILPAAPNDLVMMRTPEDVLAEGRRAAKALTDVISKKKHPVMFGGEQYLEFEDWQTVGRFYGVTAKVIKTARVDYGDVQGFEATAVALRADGYELSQAESECLSDERNWKGKPSFQLRSMAQTRACAKALRNVLAWVVVLGGYKPTPAEEMDDVRNKSAPPPNRAPMVSGPVVSAPTPAAAPVPSCIGTITDIKEVAGGALVTLSTGFVAGTKQPEILAGLKRLKDMDALCELVTRPAARNDRAPTIIEVRPPSRAGVSDPDTPDDPAF